MTIHNPVREHSVDHPVLWTVSISRLSDLFRDIAREFDDQADIEPIHIGFDDAVHHIRERLQHERCDAVISTWREVGFYSERERAALNWAESLTKLADHHGDHDGAFLPLKGLFSDQEIVELSWAIAQINAWNRMAVGMRQPPSDKPLE